MGGSDRNLDNKCIVRIIVKPKEESKTYYISKKRNSGGPPETEIHIFNKKNEK